MPTARLLGQTRGVTGTRCHYGCCTLGLSRRIRRMEVRAARRREANALRSTLSTESRDR